MISVNHLGFGNYNSHVIQFLLNHIEYIFSSSGVCSNKDVIVCYGNDMPMCCNENGFHIIYLATHENYWCQWVFQFAHEFCHHLVDGKMTGNLLGLKWFEECLCHTASLFCLSKLSNHTVWHQLGYPHYALSVRGYIDNFLHESHALRQEYYQRNSIGHREGIYLWRDILEETSTQGIVQYPRNLYNAVASLILPIFLRNDQIWEILQHIGDSEKWKSIEELLSHLKSKATPVYEEDLKDLSSILLGSA